MKKNIVKLFYEVGFTKLDEKDVYGLLQNRVESMCNEALLELEGPVVEKIRLD